MSDVITEWNPERIKQAAMERMMENAEIAGKYVEDVARQKLDAIKTPDTKRDINYRSYLSKFVLSNAVEQQHSRIVIAIGMRIGKSGQRYHGFYIETGSSTAPAHPYLRPAVTQNSRELINIILG